MREDGDPEAWRPIPRDRGALQPFARALQAHSRLDLTEPKYFLRLCAGWPHGFQRIPLLARHSWSKPTV